MKSKQKTTRRRSARSRTKRKKPAEITIRRSSGRKEKFDRDRLAITTSRSGVPFLMARDIAKNVAKQVRAESRGKKKKMVTGSRIRRIVGNELNTRNPTIGSAYVGRGSPQVAPNKGGLPKPPVSSADTDQHGAYRADRDSVMHDRSKRMGSSS